jgi:hypothetical protein
VRVKEHRGLSAAARGTVVLHRSSVAGLDGNADRYGGRDISPSAGLGFRGALAAWAMQMRNCVVLG